MILLVSESNSTIVKIRLKNLRMKKYFAVNPALLILAMLTVDFAKAQTKINVLKINSAEELHSFFEFTGKENILIAGRRAEW